MTFQEAALKQNREGLGKGFNIEKQHGPFFHITWKELLRIPRPAYALENELQAVSGKPDAALSNSK